MNYEQTKNNSHESEFLGEDERKLSVLLGGLKRVEAPKDFDFKLKAKIAAASPTDTRKPFFFPALRYVLPLCLVVMLSAFAALKIVAPSEETNPPSIAAADDFPPPNKTETAPANVREEQFTSADRAETSSAAEKAAPITAAAPKAGKNGKQTIVVVKSPVKISGKSEVKSKNGFGGDYERTARVSRVINMNPNAPNNKNLNSGQSGRIPVREVLREIGIEVEFIGADWKITAVRENTPARIANMQVGDLIEAIDDKKLSSDTAFLQSFTGKVFRVVRGGKQIVIDLTKK